MSGVSVRRSSSFGARLTVPAEDRRQSLHGSSSATSLKSAEKLNRRASSDAAIAEREKHHYDILRRRISNFVGHAAYEEKLESDSKARSPDEDSSGDESKPDNFAKNYLKGKKHLAEGSHDRMYKWMGYSSEDEMRQKSGNAKRGDYDDKTVGRKSVGFARSMSKPGTSTQAPSGEDAKTKRRRSSTGTSPHKR